MKQYCLIFQPLSSISHIPDAQTIFGSLCNIIIQTQGEDKFHEYIQSFDNEPMLIHSSMFPDHLLPMIHQGLFSTQYINQTLVNEAIDQQLSYLQNMKKYKKVPYMSQKIYEEYISTNKFEQLQQDILHSDVKFDDQCLQKSNENYNFHYQSELMTHVRKNGYYMSNENDLFFDTQYYCDKDTKFNIYVKTTLTQEQLYDIFKYTHYFGFGPKHSTGKNSFKLIDIIEEESVSSNKKLLLSKSTLDDSYQLENSFYQIHSHIHRTSHYYMSNGITGRYNLFDEGSYMSVSDDKEYYGHLIYNQCDNKDIYYYGIGYVF